MVTDSRGKLTHQPILRAEGVRAGYRDRADFLGPISLEVRTGECWAVVGPNGAGKSTFLRLFAGLLTPTAGKIVLLSRIAVVGSRNPAANLKQKPPTLQASEENLREISPRRRSRCIAYLPQHGPTELDLTVREFVLTGRYPYRRIGLFESPQDHAIAESAMRDTDSLHLAHRIMSTLSGGEAQRVHLAAALAQEPTILLLDEPTAALDLQHQMSAFELITSLARDRGLAVVMVTHDVNLAGRFCDRVLLLHDGRMIACGEPKAVLTPEVLRTVYGVELVAIPIDHTDWRWIIPQKAVGGVTR